MAIVSVVYLATPESSQAPMCGDESLELRYFTRDALQAVPLSAPNRPIVRRFLENDHACGFSLIWRHV